MPEVDFTLRWPDGTEQQCYSPSTIIADYLTAHTVYPLSDFMTRARSGLTHASDRVKALYGHPCALALGQLAAIEARAASFAPPQTITCTALSPPFPMRHP